MDAVILAAGLGTRLRPHTLTTPKPLLPVQHRPILDWTLGALPKSVDRAIIVVNYLAEQIEAYMAIQDHIPKYALVYQTEPKGTGDALRSCQAKIESERFFVLNGDDLFGAADLQTLGEQSAGILTHPVDQPKSFGIVYPREDGTMEKLVEKPEGLPAPQLANVGAYLLPEKIFRTKLELSARGEYELTDYVHTLAKTDPVQVVRASFWHPIGTAEAWRAAEQLPLAEKMTASRAE